MAQTEPPPALQRERPLGIRVRALLRRSSIGLMLMLVALGVMSFTWMSVIAVLVQKLLPPIDVPLALAIVGLGLLIVIAPSWVPGLSPPM